MCFIKSIFFNRNPSTYPLDKEIVHDESKIERNDNLSVMQKNQILGRAMVTQANILMLSNLMQVINHNSMMISDLDKVNSQDFI